MTVKSKKKKKLDKWLLYFENHDIKSKNSVDKQIRLRDPFVSFLFSLLFLYYLFREDALDTREHGNTH